MSQAQYDYDVLIIGAGLAGLTLARQLLEEDRVLRVGVISRSGFPVPEFVNKVGEATVEGGAFYLKYTVGLRENLDENHLQKMGLRFIQTDQRTGSYNEMGIDHFPYHKCYQIDRGKLENDLYQSLSDRVDFYTKSHITRIDIQPFYHSVAFRQDGKEHTLLSKWLVDASGRGRVLARKLGLEEESPLTHSAVWFRLDECIDIKDIYASSESCFVNEDRYRSTTHLIGKGYWIWIIPLRDGKTSIGVVFDHGIHDMRKLADREGMMAWMKDHEPSLYARITQSSFLDFRFLKSYSYLSSQLYSTDGWCLTGEAAGFADPLYSPGTDVVGVGNTIVTKLITASHDNFPEMVDDYNEIIGEMYKTFTGTYIDAYSRFDNWYYVFVKTNWDTIFYFLFFCPYVMNQKIGDHDFMKRHRRQYLEMCQKHLEVCAFLRGPEFQLHKYNAPRFVDIRGTIEETVNRCILAGEDADYDEIFAINCSYIEYIGNRLLAGDDFNEIFYDDGAFRERRESHSVIAGS